jgi:hypothetical protein
MANLRVVKVNAADSRTIKASFTDELYPQLTTSNVSVTAAIEGIPAPAVLGVSVRGNILVVNVRPMTPFVRHFVTFQSTDTVRFRNATSTSFLFEDGRTNVVEILGAENPSQPIRDNLATTLKENVYNLDRDTLVRIILNQLSETLLRVRHDIGEAKNDNYLQFLVQNERKIRGFGPYDRLNEEGAFEVVRVGLTEENATVPGIISFDSFPTDPVTLQRLVITGEQLTPSSAQRPQTFDKLLLTVSKTPVTKLTGVTVAYESGSTYTYDIRTLGYQIKDPTFDTQFGSTLLTLEDNQFKLNEEILDDPTFDLPGAGDTIIVSYEYKSLGRIIDEESVEVSQVLPATREAAPPITTEFSLDHAPVVTSSGGTPTSGGVQFLDPRSMTPFLTTHPAFTNEIPFRMGGLPSYPGEYSVDYETGRVFVYGAETNDGTGNFPPAMTYNYRKFFSANLDYTYEPENYLVVASPLRDLATQTARISFNYEQTLVPGVDFNAAVHLESTNERIGNRLTSTISLQPANFPVTNVFRIYNETTGEIYPVTRFNANTVYFSFNIPPRIADSIRERASFTPVSNESLITQSELVNVLGTRVLKIPLLTPKIMSSTEDLVGSSYNTSAVFSRGDVFQQEVYYDDQLLSETVNTNRLTVGDYQVNYPDGIVYVGVSAGQLLDVGTVSYRAPVIAPLNPHVVAVSKVYYSLSELQGVARELNYSSFADGAITPTTLDVSDERFLNGDTSLPYVLDAGTITVSDDIKSVRGLYDAFDLNNNAVPTNFAEITTFEANVITVDTSSGVEKTDTLIVGAGLTVTVPTISPGIVLSEALSVVRISDNQQLLDGYETISGNTITLGGSSGAVPGDVVTVIYTVTMNGAATPVVDYNRGDFYTDYTYIADEILVSYEYGDNVLDFRESDALDHRQQYFVTYRAGALRNALLSNFGSLVDIPEVQAFDVELERETYRDILTGALQSFTKGPTIPSMKLLVKNVTKIEPQVLEAAFDIWSLAISYLQPQGFDVDGTPELVAGKFDQGLLIRDAGDSVTFPVSSNLRLEEGNLEMWVIPEWNGLDNDATLTFSNLTRDGYALTASEIYIGASSFHPTISDGTFTLNRADDPSPVGLPSAVYTQTGMFIYYDDDNKLWKVLAKDRVDGSLPVDGYVFTGTIDSSGDVYDVKFIPGLGELTDVLRSGSGSIDFVFHIDAKDKASPDGYSTTDGYVAGYSFDGIQFMADDEHFLFDFGVEEDRNRFSLYKDGRGYMVFRVWDQGDGQRQLASRRSQYMVSADIQSWSAGEKHHVAISWVLDSSDRQDEMHLYIDGQEVPNIIRYGGIPPAASSDRFRTVVPEYVVGTVPLNTVTGNDMTVTAGSAVVSSATVNFAAEGIVAGNTIEILEQGFTTYTILIVSGFTLTLSASMPATLPDARFSVNPFSAVVATEIDVYRNIAVYRKAGGVETELPGLRADIPGYQIERNSLNQNVLTILGDAQAGDQILIRTLGLNHRRCRDTIYFWSQAQSILKTGLPPPINLDDVSIVAVLLPLVPIGPDNSALVLGNFVASLTTSQTTNATEGRNIDVRVTGGNVNFSTPTTVTINGTSTGPATEVLSFSAAGIQTSVNKWKTITSVDIVTKPIVTTRDGAAVEIKETYSVTNPNGNTAYPVIRFAYQTQAGNSLTGDGSVVVEDLNGFFPDSDVGNLLQITDPAPVAGIYEIDSKVNNRSVRLDPAPGVAFTGGRYGIFNISIGRSGFQNGFFYLETVGFTNTPYVIPSGYYEFDYAAYLEVPFDPITQRAYIGTDMTTTKPAKAVIDELRILNLQMTDTRVGESIALSEESVTTSYNALRPFTKNVDTLVLLHFEELPPVNDTDFYKFAHREYVQSGTSVNERFGHSIVVRDKGLIFDNKNRLTTETEGTIEFWVSPRFDTYNDPVPRVYFDAASAETEDVTSLTKGTVQIAGRASQVLSVRLASDTTNTGVNYFEGGTLASDTQTINLGQSLPFQQTPVKVAYVPTSLRGDRLTIYKDSDGFISFNVRANNGQDIEVRQPVFWPRDTWHRIRASFKFNSVNNLDEIRLFVDGEERGMVLFGQGLLFGEGFVFGQNTVGVGDQILVTDINFLDPITQFSIGMDYTGSLGAEARIDNVKLSNKSIAPWMVGGQAKDVYFNTNPAVIFPAIEDVYTTFLMNFDQLVTKTNDFSTIRDPAFGVFNFTLNIIDSFDIVLGDARVQQILEAMIEALKPAVSKAEINYIQ